MLKPRITDTNKVVQSLALDIVARIASGMNKPFERYCRIVVLPIAQVMADQKTNIRALAGTTLTTIATACEGIDSMTHFLGTALESPNPLLRGTLLGWLAGWLKENEIGPGADLSTWTGPLVSCLEDKSADVRKCAQAVLPAVVLRVGYDHFMDKVNTLKPASRATIAPLVQAAKPASQSKAPVVPASAPAPTSKKLPPPPPSPPAESLPSEMPPPKSKGLLSRRMDGAPRPAARVEETVERPSSQASLRGTLKSKVLGLKRPGSTMSKPSVSAPPPAVVNTSSSTFPFLGAMAEPKRARLQKDQNRWVIESGPSRKDLAELLQHQMEPYVTKDLIAMLFSHDHNAINDHISGLNMICECYTSAAAGEESHGLSTPDVTATLLATVDLPLKYVSIKVHEPQPNLISRCLDVVDSILSFLGSASYVLSDPEAACFVPTIIHKVSIFIASDYKWMLNLLVGRPSRARACSGPVDRPNATESVLFEPHMVSAHGTWDSV